MVDDKTDPMDRLLGVAARLFVWGQALVPRLLELAGYAAITYGAWLALPSLGWVVGGVCTLNIALGRPLGR